MKKVGIVGLGIMGRGIGTNFLKKGYPVFVWNRTASVVKSFAKKGAIVCKTPADVALRADVVFEVTANDRSSKHVWEGRNGILSGAQKNTILIECATVSVQRIDELIAACRKRRLRFCDMAMTGGRIGAESGSLTLLCGGEKKTVDGLKPTLSPIAAKVLYFGPAGQGMRYKLILNFLQAVHVIGFRQAMQIAKAHNMDIKKVGEALSDRPGGVITNLAWRDYFREPDPINFSIEWITKDLTYAKKFAKSLDIRLLDQTLAVYNKAIKKGLGKKDWASVHALL